MRIDSNLDRDPGFRPGRHQLVVVYDFVRVRRSDSAVPPVDDRIVGQPGLPFRGEHVGDLDDQLLIALLQFLFLREIDDEKAGQGETGLDLDLALPREYERWYH